MTTLTMPTRTAEWLSQLGFSMKTHKNLYKQVISLENLYLAWRKARKGKTKKSYIIEFEHNLFCNLMALHYELKYFSYDPKSLETFILRDPKTRKISKSDFKDRIVHHAIVNILEPIFDPSFIYDSCANRKGKGNLFAIKRFYLFLRKITQNGKRAKNRFMDNNYVVGYAFKADTKHYFEEVNHHILLKIIKRKISDKNTIWLIKQILMNKPNFRSQKERNNLDFWLESQKGMPLGNLTSQFFANVYLNELDYYVKHILKAKYYIRYVDDFIILHRNKKQLVKWKNEIDCFLKKELLLELHKQKSRIIPLSRGIDFAGFRNFYLFNLPRKRNIRKMRNKIILFEKLELSYRELMESFKGWNAYVKWSNSLNLRRKILKEIQKVKKKECSIK